MNKLKIYILGLITLIVFPIIGYILYFWIEDKSVFSYFDFDQFKLTPIGLGLQFGFFYAFIAIIALKASVFQDLPLQFDQIIGKMKLNIWDIFFISLCAGIGEELLFRQGVQAILGPVLTSVIFVAIHGYIGFRNPRMSYYGLLVFPFTLGLAYGFIEFGIWFSIAAHFCYDFVIFYHYIKD